MTEITCFDDLVFRPHRNGYEGAVQSQHELPNGITISVVGGQGLYGNGESTFEVAAWETNNPLRKWLRLTDITHHSGGDDVLGWLDKDEVTEVIQILLDYQIENPEEVTEDID